MRCERRTTSDFTNSAGIKSSDAVEISLFGSCSWNKSSWMKCLFVLPLPFIKLTLFVMRAPMPSNLLIISFLDKDLLRIIECIRTNRSFVSAILHQLCTNRILHLNLARRYGYSRGKLPYYGIFGIEQHWIADYLFNRQQFVSAWNTQSDPQHIQSGVLQGSVLGSHLFLILINDTYLSLEKCTMLIYADDAVLLFFSHKSKEIEETLMGESKLLITWLTNSSLVPNFKPGKLKLFSTALPKS